MTDAAIATDDTPKRKLDSAAPDAALDAQMQADEYDSLFGKTRLDLDGGGHIMVPPHPDYGMLSDEAMDAYDQLRFEVDTEYEREDDIYIPEQKLLSEDGKPTGVTLPASTQRGALKVPYRKIDPETRKSVRVTPPHSVKIAMIALGDTEYKRLVEGGRSSADVWEIWGRQQMRIKDREKRDRFPDGGAVAVEAVPQADRE